ncbi:MAG: ribonuclease III [Lachnospiraceae bacterium]|nr:ribonuclease III [Lachnospiraceae bacterium]
MGEHRDFFGEIEERFGMPERMPEQYSALGLAYIGDGVYDLIIRTIVVDLGNRRVNLFHKMTTGIVKAESQAKLMREIMEYLTPEEEAVFRHGRNAKSSSSAKNASIADYRIATGFEALIGYLYLRHDLPRVLELVKIGLEKSGQMPD